jgi:hypothetical protein
VAELDALGMIWDPHEYNWRRAIAAALDYRERHGHLRPPYTFVTEDGLRLGNWISGRRTDRNRGKLSSDRIAALDAIGMDWDAREANWQDGIREARAYREMHGDLDVPSSFLTTDGFRLGSWIQVKRWRRRQGTLSDDRVRALDALGMTWDLSESDWKRGLVAAQAYREAHGDLRVPSSFLNDDGFALGSWIHARRTERNLEKLASERIAALDALGMVWDAREELWARGIAAACAYRRERGDLLVPVKFVTDDGFRLGSWIDNKRQERKRGALPNERIKALNALDMVWNVGEDRWQRGLAAARSYVETHGDLRVPAKFVTDDGFALGVWISGNRQDRDRGKLSPERLIALDALGITWDAREDEWQRGIEAARRYRDAHGHLRVPHSYATDQGFKLGAWIANRRTGRKRGALVANRVAALDALGMVWDARIRPDPPREIHG